MTTDEEQEVVRADDFGDGVLELRLNRPARLNAITRKLLHDLRAHFQRAGADARVRAVLLTGEGRAFCAGQDLNERDPGSHDWPFDLEAIQRADFQPALAAIAECPKPVVVAVNGVASGAGAGIALAGDIVLAGQSARFDFSFARVGLSSDAACAWRLVHALGPAHASALLMTGGGLNAEEAERARLIWRCLPDGELQQAARELARRLADGPTLAHALVKQVVRAAASQSFEDYLATEARLQGVAGRSGDYREGVTAFLHKRTPSFSGR